MEVKSSFPKSDVITIGELTSNRKGPIWIVNTSDSFYPSGAEVYITLQNGDQNTVFSMPRTWLPIELTERYPRKVIINSAYFIEAVSKGLITAISQEAATKLLSQKGVERERQRLQEIEDSIRAATSARGIGRNVMISTGDPERDAELAKDFQSNKKSSGNDPDETRGTEAQATAAKTLRMAGDEEEAEEVSANFQAWVHKLNGLGDKDDARTEIRMRGTMSLPEAIYLLRNINYEEIAETLRKKLKKLGEEV